MVETAGGPLTPRKFVYTGREWISGGKVGGTLRPIDEHGEVGQPRYYERKALRMLIIVGGVYEIEASDTQIKPHSAKFLNVYEDKDTVEYWRLQDRKFETERLLKAREKAAKTFDLSGLNEIRDAYRRTNARGRLAIEVELLAYLRHGGLDKI